VHGASELQLIAASIAAISLSIWLIVRTGLHPIIGLLCGAFVLGLLGGVSPQSTAAAVQKGFGDVLGGTGIVIALGLTLGAMLQFSGAASALAESALRAVGVRNAPWGSLFAAMIIGLPLFFETGAVLLLPIVAAAAARLPVRRGGANPTLALMLPAVAGLSVLHALLPPHPGPLLAVHELGANVGRTMLYGLVVSIPTAIIAGPVFARYAARNITVDAPALPVTAAARAPHLLIALFVVLLPVVLIALSAARDLLPASVAGFLGWIAALGNPVLALLIANLAGLALLFRRQPLMADDKSNIWHEAMKPAGTFLLSIGAGGALKQVLISVGMADAMSRFAGTGLVSPLITAWAVAVLIRISTGSATVATITAAGVMSGVVATTGVSPEWMVLAIGAGSVFFSHVNDAGFWLVKAYLGTTTTDTFKTWSVLETIISVVGLLAVLGASQIF
jgi:gluconate:H+ symporter, GntP family